MLEILQQSLPTLTLDIIIVAVAGAALLFYALRYGKSKIIALILALYFGLLAFTNFPFLEFLLIATGTTTQLLLSKLLIFIGFVFLAYIVLAKIIVAEFPRAGTRRFIEAGLLTLAALSLLLAFSYNVLPVAEVLTFPNSIRQLFASPDFFFWWLILPLVVLFFTGRR